MLSREQIRKLILEEDLITGYHDMEEQLQTNGFDLTIKGVGIPTEVGRLGVDNKDRVIPDIFSLDPSQTRGFYEEYTGWWHLKPGVYQITLNEKVKIPLDLAAVTIQRSSVMRCGVRTNIGFWDAGYEGMGVSYLYVGNPHGFHLEEGARIIQMFFLRLEEAVELGYTGIYHKEEN